MVTLVPRADTGSGRVLQQIGRFLGLRAETVYSRTILLVALVQFIVLGLAVVGVWLAVTEQFRRADEQELLSTAQRVKAYFESQADVSPEALARRAAALTGRRIYLRDSTEPNAVAGILFSGRPGSSEKAFFRLRADADSASAREVVVTGTVSFYETGLSAARIFVVGLALAGGLMVLVMLFVVDRTIVGRIQLLADKVEHEKDSERLPVKLDYPGDDELAMLARSIEELALLVQEAEREYRHVVEDQTECICRFDANGHITFSNKAFQALCETPLAGKRPLLAGFLERNLSAVFEQALSERTPSNPITQFTHAGSGERWYRSTLRANFDNDGRFVGGQWIAGDVTSEVAARCRLQESQKQLARLSARLMTLQDDERRRLARELHDSTAQSLAALEINMSALANTTNPAEVKRLADEAGATSRQVCDELRTISYLLHPPLLEEAGLVFALRWLADGFTKRNGMPVSVDVPENFPRLSAELETALFRIVQESLSNIYRHAGATKAWIALARSDAGDVTLEIRDNGEGLPDDFSLLRSSGVGLAGMRERMRELGGTLDIESSEFGVAVKCRLKRDVRAETGV